MNDIIKFKPNQPIEIKLESDSILEKGYGLISRNVMRDKNISASAKTVYCYLVSFAGNKGVCYPSLELIRNELGFSKNTLNKYMKELRKSGLVKVFRLQNEENNLLSNNIYEIAMNYSTIEENKKAYSNKINTPKKTSIGNPSSSDDKIQALLNSKLFTIEEITDLSIDKINRAYELIRELK